MNRADAYAYAYGCLHEVVRMHLAGQVNVRCVRKRHAEIESELREAIEKERDGD